MLKVRGICVAIVLVFTVVSVFSCGVDAATAVVTVELQFLDKDGNDTFTDYTGPVGTPDGILDINPGEEFQLRVLVSGPSAGISGGSVDVTLTQDLEAYFTGFTMSSGVTVVAPNGTVQDGAAPQLDDIGKGSFIFTAGFANPGPVEFFTASGFANTTPGMMDFATSQGLAQFAIVGQGNTDDVAWGDGSIYVVPEPASLSLLALGGLVALRRRRNTKQH